VNRRVTADLLCGKDLGKMVKVGNREPCKLRTITVNLWSEMPVVILYLEGVGCVSVFPETLCDVQEDGVENSTKSMYVDKLIDLSLYKFDHEDGLTPQPPIVDEWCNFTGEISQFRLVPPE